MDELKPCPYTESDIARKLRTFKGVCTIPGLDDLILWAADIIQAIRAAYTENPAKALNMLPELFQQYDEGLIKVLPCKVGTTVYVDTRTFQYGEYNSRYHAEALVTSFAFGHRNFVKLRIFSPYVNQWNIYKYPLSAFGKTVFLTRPEAEKALESEP